MRMTFTTLGTRAPQGLIGHLSWYATQSPEFASAVPPVDSLSERNSQL
jgi:hypothetical protein